MDFQILGSFEVLDDGAVVRIPAGRERALLALLLVNRGRVVSADAIVHALWGESPPGTAAKAVQGYVSHLRRLLPEGAIVTRPPGYVLEVAARMLTPPAPATRRRRPAAARRGGRPGGRGRAAGGPRAVARPGPRRRRVRRVRPGRDPPPRGAAAGGDRGPRRGAAAPRPHRRAGRRARRARRRPPAARAARGTGDARPLPRGAPGRRPRASTSAGRRLDLAAELGVDPGPELARAHRAILNQDPALGGPAREAPAAPAPRAGRPSATRGSAAAARSRWPRSRWRSSWPPWRPWPSRGTPAAAASRSTLPGRGGDRSGHERGGRLRRNRLEADLRRRRRPGRVGGGRPRRHDLAV